MRPSSQVIFLNESTNETSSLKENSLKKFNLLEDELEFDNNILLQKECVSSFLKWLQDTSASRTTPHPKIKKIKKRMKALAAIPGESAATYNITDFANTITEVWSIPIPVVIYPDIKNIVATHHCQITTLAIPVSVQEKFGNGDFHDYYYITQSGLFSVTRYTTKKNLSIYAHSYEMLAKPSGKISPYVELIQTTPDTTIGYTSVTSSLSYGFGGDVGFFGYTPTGNINGNYSISNSKTISIPDVSVRNLCLTDEKNETAGKPSFGTQNLVKGKEKFYPNTARWLYSINDPKKTLMGSSTFEPYNQWLWRVDKKARTKADSFTFITTFKPTYEFSDKVNVYKMMGLTKKSALYSPIIKIQKTISLSFPPAAGPNEDEDDYEDDHPLSRNIDSDIGCSGNEE